VIALNLVQRHRYRPTRQAISELALGSGGSLMAVAFCGLGVGIFLLATSIQRTSQKARVTPLLLVVASVLAGPVSAIFHTDRSGAKTTLHGTIHDTAGLLAFLLILLAMITGAYRFRREPWWRRYALPTEAFAALAAVTFVLIPTLGANHFGLAQRLFVGTFVAWLLVTAGYARSRSTAIEETHVAEASSVANSAQT
jgi:predicted membrane channel-forming protein YqfA (hemolysin III family)